MPSITFSYNDFQQLVGKKLSEQEFVRILDYAKAELDSALSSECTIKFNDTNLPYLWSVEGLARFFRFHLGIQKTFNLSAQKSKHKVMYDKRLKKIRPHIACFTAHGKKIDEYLLTQLIQLQEKLCENFGKKRQKISIGVYPLHAIAFPVSCKAAQPTDTFTPLDFRTPLTLKAILDKHPKGKEYGHLIKDSSIYPVFIDANKEILSLVPIINSEQTGRLQAGDTGLFFDTTGTDEDSVNLVANIFAYALADRGFSIEQMSIQYPEKTVITPTLKPHTIKIKEQDACALLGIALKSLDIKKLLHMAGYEYHNGTVTIPPYRNDVMHPVDIYEDIAISYGYNTFEPAPLTTYTPGDTLLIARTVDAHRLFWIGLGYQEVMSAVLSNKELLYDLTLVSDPGTVEIDNYVSQTYSCIRTWILPILLEMLSKNKHVEYPQRLFEEGLVAHPNKPDEHHLAAVSAHTGSTFTEMRQAIESTLRNSNHSCRFEEYDLGCFIPGRAARVYANDKLLGILGEIHPCVLEKFGLLVPVVGCELNLSALR